MTSEKIVNEENISEDEEEELVNIERLLPYDGTTRFDRDGPIAEEHALPISERIDSLTLWQVYFVHMVVCFSLYFTER